MPRTSRRRPVDVPAHAGVLEAVGHVHGEVDRVALGRFDHHRTGVVVDVHERDRGRRDRGVLVALLVGEERHHVEGGEPDRRQRDDRPEHHPRGATATLARRDVAAVEPGLRAWSRHGLIDRTHCRTARTRRWSSSAGGRSSLVKMLLTCFSTALSLTTRARAIAGLLRPSAISASTSRSRGVSRSSGSRRRERASSCATTSGSSAVPPAPTRRTRLDELADVGDAVLQQVADAAGVAGEQLGGVALLDVLRQHEDADVGPPARGSRSPARSPSSVCVGGMRTSVTTRSGWWRSTAAAARRHRRPWRPPPRRHRRGCGSGRPAAARSPRRSRSARQLHEQVVGPPGGLIDVHRPAQAGDPVAQALQPAAASPGRRHRAPLSRTSTTRRSPARAIDTEAWVAPACWATLVSASATTK